MNGDVAFPDRLFFLHFPLNPGASSQSQKHIYEFCKLYKKEGVILICSLWGNTHSHSDNDQTRTKPEHSKTNKQLFTYIHRPYTQLYIHSKNYAYVYKIKII